MFPRGLPCDADVNPYWNRNAHQHGHFCGDGHPCGQLNSRCHAHPCSHHDARGDNHACRHSHLFIYALAHRDVFICGVRLSDDLQFVFGTA